MSRKFWIGAIIAASLAHGCTPGPQEPEAPSSEPQVAGVQLEVAEMGQGKPPVPDAQPTPAWARCTLTDHGKPYPEPWAANQIVEGRDAKGSRVEMGLRRIESGLVLFPETGYIHVEAPVSVKVRMANREIGHVEFATLPDERPLFDVSNLKDGNEAAITFSRPVTGDNVLNVDLGDRWTPKANECVLIRLVRTDYHRPYRASNLFHIAGGSKFGPLRATSWMVPYASRAKAVELEIVRAQTKREVRKLSLVLQSNSKYTGKPGSDEPRFLIQGAPPEWRITAKELNADLYLDFQIRPINGSRLATPLVVRSLARLGGEFTVEGKMLRVNAGTSGIQPSPPTGKETDLKAGDRIPVVLDWDLYWEKSRERVILPLNYDHLPIRKSNYLEPQSLVVPGQPVQELVYVPH